MGQGAGGGHGLLQLITGPGSVTIVGHDVSHGLTQLCVVSHQLYPPSRTQL